MPRTMPSLLRKLQRPSARLGVRHLEIACDTAGKSRPAFGCYGSLLLQPRLTEVYVAVDESWETSKMNTGIFGEAMFGVIRLKWDSLFREYPDYSRKAPRKKP